MTAYSFMMLFKLTLRLDYANYEESILEVHENENFLFIYISP